MQAAGIASEISQTAGTFVCNHIFYGLMHALQTRGRRKVRGGFVHVPWLPGQGQPSLALGDLEKGLLIAVRTALATGRDLHRQGGALD